MRHEKKLPEKIVELSNLFKTWSNYNERTINLMNQNKFDMKERSCPVIHCTWGFDKNELQNDVPKLKEGALKNKDQLIDIIKYSANDDDRGQAILILANTNEYREIATLMIGFLNDSSELVRNNSMRVLGAILSKYDVPGLNVHNILWALNYPYVTDRNKAAYILWSIVLKDKSSYPLIIKESGTTLINLLKLKQPNNHDLAYSILKAISHKNYSERNYQDWQRWLELEQNKLQKA